jgi:hypothetical protein
MNGSSFEAPTLGIGRLLKDGSRYIVPHHQRDYSWTEDKIEQLFTDVLDAMMGNQKEYFIGLMVFMPCGHSEYTILDGQQRLATTVIILASIRSWLNIRPYAKDANQIQRDYIAARELGREEEKPRLVLNENNNPFFNRFVIDEAPSSAIEKELVGLNRYDVNRRILQAILFCRKRIDEIISKRNLPDDQASNFLFNLVKYLEDSVKVVRLTVSSETDAYTVFETLNDRGLDLTVLDLVKNYLFGKAGNPENLRDITKQWTQIMATLSNVPADDFLKVWWTSRYGRVQTAQLFPKFKEQAKSWTKVRAIAEDMVIASEQYAALEIADDPIWADISESGRDRVRSLKLLGAKQVHPILLSALMKFPIDELERLLRLLEVLIVRYQLIGGGRTGRLEITSASLANQIWEGKVKSAAEALRVVKDLIPADPEFREAFRIKQERNNQKASWLLTKLETQARQAEKTDVSARELEPSNLSLTLEHILPKNPSLDWEEVLIADPAFVEECTFRLGNMCLLTKINRQLGNKGFIDKKKVFSKSDLILTQKISEYNEWNQESVDQRQRKLAKLAAALWRFD